METFLGYLGTAGAVVFVFAALGFCILFHEFGHFLAAKMLGLHVDAFSLGFRPFWRKKYKGVEYRIGYLPFGGYVEIPQIDCSDAVPKAADGTELRPGTAKERIITAAAGPLFNIISGLLIGCIIWIWGMPQDTPKMRQITVNTVTVESPEYQAGLRKGDIITKLNGKEFFLSWAKFVEQILYTTGEVTLEVVRDGKKQLISYTPIDNPNAPGSIRKEGVGYPFFTPKVPIQIFPRKDSPAEKAGLKSGDIVLEINGETINDYLQFQMIMDMSANRPMKFLIERGKERLEYTVSAVPLEGVPEHTHYVIGIVMEQLEKDKPVKVSNLYKYFPAAMAGIIIGDEIVTINGKKVTTSSVVANTVNESKTAPVTLEILRDGKLMKFTLTPQVIRPSDIGVSMAVYDYPSPWRQFCDTLNMTWKAIRGIATGIGNKLGLTKNTSTLKPSHMSGPLGIGMVLFTSIRTSPAVGIYMMVVISFALAIFNLLPLPVLDGGHIFFGLLEVIFRKPVPQGFMKVLSYIFVTLLISLMVFVTFFDIRRAFNKIVPDKVQTEQVKNAPQNP